MNKLKIKEMANYEKPIEKLLESGAEKLSDAELLAIILRSGSRDMSVIEMSQYILNDHPIHKGLHGLNYRNIKELTEIPGVGKVKACQIVALTEISRRISERTSKDKLCFDSSESVADYFMEQVRYLTKERVYALFTNTHNDYIHKVLLSEGSLDRSILTPRELFIEALKADAASIILIHNHPSGNPEPSDMDIVITKKIASLGNEISIRLLDHIIIGDGTYISMAATGLI